MTADQGPVVQSALLRSELVRLRKQKNLTQDVVARTLEWSPSKLIRIEGGKSSITRTDLQALLAQYDVTSESRVEQLQSFARGARERAWWDAYKGDMPADYLNFVGYEAGASVIRHFQATVVPGLLQTEEYAEVLSRTSLPSIEVAPAIKLRMQRQRELSGRDEPPRQVYVLDEAVIRRHIGVKSDPAIMPNQLQHICDLVERDDLVTVRVIPFGAGEHVGRFGAFVLLEFTGALPDVLYLEGGRSLNVMISGDDPRVAEYRDDFESLVDDALPADKSLELIRAAAADLMA